MPIIIIVRVVTMTMMAMRPGVTGVGNDRDDYFLTAAADGGDDVDDYF